MEKNTNKANNINNSSNSNNIIDIYDYLRYKKIISENILGISFKGYINKERSQTSLILEIEDEFLFPF